MLTFAMFGYAIGALLVLHGLVHTLYVRQAWRPFERQSGPAWPVRSWALTWLLGTALTRSLAGVACALAAVGLMVGGAELLLEQQQDWTGLVVLGSLVFSAFVFILFWDGNARRLDQKGAIGVLIDIGVLVVLLEAYWISS